MTLEGEYYAISVKKSLPKDRVAILMTLEGEYYLTLQTKVVFLDLSQSS